MNLNKIYIPSPTNVQMMLEDAKRNHKEVFVYLRSVDDHNFNIKKELIVKVDPNCLVVNGRNDLVFDDKTVDKQYMNDFILNGISDKYIDKGHDVGFYNRMLYIYFLSNQNIHDYIEELENEKKDIALAIQRLSQA